MIAELDLQECSNVSAQKVRITIYFYCKYDQDMQFMYQTLKPRYVA